MKDLIIVGASGFGREILMVIKEINRVKEEWNVLGFIDDNLNALDGIDCDCKILGTISSWKPTGNELYVMGIAKSTTKKEVALKLKDKGAKFATVIHPTARVANPVTIGEGLVLFSYADISVNCVIGNYVFLNSFAQVGHDSIIGDFSTLCPNCAIAGGGILGEGVTVGTAASTHPNIKIGNYATVGMNSAVIRNVKEHTTVMGVPAKKIM